MLQRDWLASVSNLASKRPFANGKSFMTNWEFFLVHLDEMPAEFAMLA